MVLNHHAHRARHRRRNRAGRFVLVFLAVAIVAAGVVAGVLLAQRGGRAPVASAPGTPAGPPTASSRPTAVAQASSSAAEGPPRPAASLAVPTLGDSVVVGG